MKFAEEQKRAVNHASGRVLGARWIGLEIMQAQHLLLSTASVSVLGYEHNLAEAPAIVLWNTVSTAFLT